MLVEEVDVTVVCGTSESVSTTADSSFQFVDVLIPLAISFPTW